MSVVKQALISLYTEVKANKRFIAIKIAQKVSFFTSNG